ncbi:MAG: HlyD family efflux transporter periplasmic adaptor subunit [Planctomycetes bacterium]|jgi:multidrug efflux pump subunit AcrA (membrane-fusion protein)|nr:HlyD family efflux transporter periplasmic adaptor subunit [Planctomycetota bacterium]
MNDSNSASRWLKRLLVLAALAGTAVALGAIAPGLMPSATKIKHLTHKVSRGDLSVMVTENGAVESSNNKEIKCMVKGGSTVLWVIETGTMVKPGDELVKLDQSQIEDKILQQKIVFENALANKITAESDVAVAQTSITEYLEGTFKAEKSNIEKEIFEAEQALRKSELAVQSALRLTAKGVVKDLQLEGEQFAVDSARKDLEMKRTKLESLEKYNKVKSVQELESKLRAAQAKLASYEASLSLEQARLEREKKQLENCVIRAETEGMVIFPSMAAWKDTPDITEGAVVREQQTLLMIPDFTQMQVKVGIHESKVDRLKVGMKAKVQLQELVLEGEVSEIAEVTRPAGWWTGNLVKYDTIIKLPQHPGLKPGMSAVVDIVLAEHKDVLTVPVAAIIEGSSGLFCWIQTPEGVRKRLVKVGDTNDQFSIILDGLSESDEVVLNPLAYIDEAQELAMELDQGGRKESETSKDTTKSKSP